MPYEYETSPEYAQLRLSEAIGKLRSYPPIAEINDPEKLYAIGMGFIKDMEGFNLNGVHPECDPYFEKAANMGHLAAQKQLGKGYTTYNYSEEYYNKAKHWMAKAAAQGDDEAKQLLNNIISKITEYATLLPRAEQGDITAQIKYAKFLTEGYRLEERTNVYEQAEIWLRKAVAQGSAEAEYELANLLITISGYKKAKNPQYAKYDNETIRLLTSAAIKGQALAAYSLALDYRQSHEIDKAIEFFMIAAQAGDVHAMSGLAEMYGTKAVQDKSFNASKVVWLQRAAEAGDTRAKWELEQELNQQVSNPTIYDLEETKINKLLEAAKLGDVKAQIEVAKLYASEEYEDYTQAEHWLLEAVKSGNADAEFELAKLYDDEVIPKKGEKHAIKLLMSAVAKGHVESAHALGELYADKETAESYKLAEEFYLTAALKEHSDAQFAVAELYAYSHIVGKTLEDAVHWYQSAAKNGNKYAATKLSRLPKAQIFDKANVEVHLASAAANEASSMLWLGDYYWDMAKQNHELYIKSFSWYQKASKAYTNLAVGEHTLRRLKDKLDACQEINVMNDETKKDLKNLKEEIAKSLSKIYQDLYEADPSSLH